MTALDVLPLDYVKESILGVDFPDKDDFIESLIKTSIAWVERYTGYRLYERTEQFNVYPASCDYGGRAVLPYFPITINSITDKNNATTTVFKTTNGPLKLYVYTACSNKINATVGYAEDKIADIPQPLLDAACKLIVYLYENHSAYAATIPTDIQLLINQYRRDSTI
ncbi:MAG TPA: head-tail connector protein [Candidatus Babeliaceae bacterium]|nr:head-tail connector protein [Candidatus Babeliaceae bacterium]